MKFDLSNIPEGSIINSTDLKLYCYYNGLYEIPFVGVFGSEWTSWYEETITFLNSNFSGDLLDYHFIYYGDTWHTWDVTNFVQNHIGERVTFFLMTSTDTGWASFWSKEWLDENEQPKLIIDYLPPNQLPTCSLSANPTSGYRPLTVTFSISACILEIIVKDLNRFLIL